jgi:hypothetical protein
MMLAKAVFSLTTLMFFGLSPVATKNAAAAQMHAETPTAPQSASQVGTCTTTRTRFRVEESAVGTSSSAEAAIPGATLTFAKTGSAGCVVLRFSAETTAASNRWIIVRPYLDNQSNSLNVWPLGAGGAVWTDDHDEDADGNGYRVYSFEWILPNVSVGSHTVKLNWACHGGASTGFPGCWLKLRTLTLMFQ